MRLTFPSSQQTLYGKSPTRVFPNLLHSPWLAIPGDNDDTRYFRVGNLRDSYSGWTHTRDNEFMKICLAGHEEEEEEEEKVDKDSRR